MNRVFVLDTEKRPLMPCTQQRAYELLRTARAAIYRHIPFTIILKAAMPRAVAQPLELRADPGSKTTGLALVAAFTRGDTVVFAVNLQHRSARIRKAIQQRAAYRRRRRNANLRHRPARFNNRTRPVGWLPPSLQSRVDNILSWTRHLQRFTPLSSIAVELVRFDMQAMQRPGIAGIEYQQGTLAGYEVREYLLEKWQRTCAYCDAKDTPLEIEHVVPKSRGGSNCVSNLTLACKPCNDAKDNMPVEQFLARDPVRLAKIKKQLKAPLRDAAAVNATRYAIGNALKAFGLPTAFWSGGRTKMNRIAQGYAKDHWIDAACVGDNGSHVRIPATLQPLRIKATGRGTRQVRRTNAYGFPRGSAKTAKRRHAFSTGDLVRARISKGKAPGLHVGRIQSTGAKRFDVKTLRGVIGTTHRNLTLLQRDFGYATIA
ncbi:MAG: RNA-guided endonuclease IscB [Vulcanimicrobiaceae bacterium]